ncbi:MAG TPA: DUF2332 domain-containing protein, partial [Stellaceae bacterium]|nr:DUF2332 domain-containing protein [Stellaceae bacterium]
MAALDEVRRLANWYTAFATDEARGISEIYERLALAVAASPELLGFLLTLPAPKRQPNLFFAAVGHLHGVPADVSRLAAIVRQDRERIRALMLSRTTQTNEPARCAAILPLLATLPPPLALIEVGASAGLCLLPDRYGYDYGGRRIEPPHAATDAPVFACRTGGAVPVPEVVPPIIWRRGLDLNPIDLHSDAECAWLETLVWPGQDERAQRLKSAIALARADPPPMIKGDLLSDTQSVIASAPRDATVVVFHTAALTYVRPQATRDRFAETMLKSG